MKKKIVLFFLLFIFTIILIIATLVYNSKKTNTNDRTIGINNNYSTEYYNVKTGRVRVGSLLEYLLWNNDYKNIPVTENYIKNNKLSLCEKYGLINYTGVIQRFGIEDSDTVIFDCGIYDGPYDEFILIKKQYYKYFLDENGLLDDIKFIKEEVYREEDGTPIIRPNSRKFDNYLINYFEYLVLGIDYLKYDREEFQGRDNGNYQDIEWEMREYALTDNLKRRYDLNKGLVPGELKEEAYNNNDRIGFCYKNNYFSFRKDFPKEKKATVPIELYLDYGNKQYTYNLSYSITDDYFLDDIFIEKQ